MLVASAISIAGCGAAREPARVAHPLLLPPSEIDAEPRVVTAREASSDLDVAVSLFAEAYAAPEGRSPLPPRERIEEARRTLAAQPTWSPLALSTLLRDLFRTDDGHLAFGHGGKSPLRLVALDAPVEAPRVARLPVELVPGDVPVLAVRTFESAAEGVLSELPRYAEQLSRAPAFVIDLRGNHGGNYELAERFLLSLATGPVRALGSREVQSFAAALGRINAAQSRLARGDVHASARTLFAEHIERLEGLAEELAPRPSARIELVRRGELLVGRARAPLAGRGVVLVDRGCASACEMFVALARQVPGLIIAGERTRGSMAVGEVALFRLPSSGVLLTLGTRAIVDPLGDFDETRGFSPDVVLSGPDLLADARSFVASGARDAWMLASARAPSLVEGRDAPVRAASVAQPREEPR
jgi:hypothetical protein